MRLVTQFMENRHFQPTLLDEFNESLMLLKENMKRKEIKEAMEGVDMLKGAIEEYGEEEFLAWAKGNGIIRPTDEDAYTWLSDVIGSGDIIL